jgi:hypothetical protein
MVLNRVEYRRMHYGDGSSVSLGLDRRSNPLARFAIRLTRTVIYGSMFIACLIWWTPWFIAGALACATVALAPLGLVLFCIGAWPLKTLCTMYAKRGR